MAFGLRPNFMLWLPMLIGGGLVLGAGLAIWSEVAFRAGAQEADAVVVAFDSHYDRDSNGRPTATHRAIFDLPLGDDRTIRAIAALGDRHPCCEVGDTVRVRYDPAMPQRVWLAGFLDIWMLPLVLGGFGVLWLGGGWLVLMAFGGEAKAGPPPRPASRRVRLGILGVRQDATPDGPRWVIHARPVDGGDDPLATMESEPLEIDPRPRLEGQAWLWATLDPAPGARFQVDRDTPATLRRR